MANKIIDDVIITEDHPMLVEIRAEALIRQGYTVVAPIGTAWSWRRFRMVFKAQLVKFENQKEK